MTWVTLGNVSVWKRTHDVHAQSTAGTRCPCRLAEGNGRIRARRRGGVNGEVVRVTLHGPPTMRDVALRAGVGVGTVSRVVNGGNSVRPQTAARVQAAIDALGFRRNDI